MQTTIWSHGLSRFVTLLFWLQSKHPILFSRYIFHDFMLKQITSDIRFVTKLVIYGLKIVEIRYFLLLNYLFLQKRVLNDRKMNQIYLSREF